MERSILSEINQDQLIYPLPEVTLKDILDASERIKPWAHRTPIMTSSTMNRFAGKELFFKCEIFQKVGAFKFRGALNAVMKLEDSVARKGVVRV